MVVLLSAPYIPVVVVERIVMFDEKVFSRLTWDR